MIVAAMISVLAGGIIVALDPGARINMSRDGVRKSDLRQIQSALEMYRSDLGAYPASITCNSTLVSGGVTYMQKAPCDPIGTAESYLYTPVGTPPTGYTLRACLQTGGDLDADQPSVGCPVGRYSLTVRNP